MKIVCKHLNLKQIADSGQTFRWYEKDDGYVVVANKQAVVMKQLEDGIEIDSEIGDWHYYLDTERDYGYIMDMYRGKDDFLDAAIDYGSGIRILNQDPFETTMTFIISANNNIKRISASVLELSNRYGSYIKRIDGVDYYAFPSPDQLKDVTISDFRACGVGYRDKYLYECVQDILSGRIDLESISNMEDKELKSSLLRLKGVGEKVANCIILFAYGRYEGFPVDTWIKKVLKEEYHVEKNYQAFVNDYFKPLGGIAQQYLFFYGRR